MCHDAEMGSLTHRGQNALALHVMPQSSIIAARSRSGHWAHRVPNRDDNSSAIVGHRAKHVGLFPEVGLRVKSPYLSRWRVVRD